jgi:hypothetical protein
MDSIPRAIETIRALPPGVDMAEAMRAMRVPGWCKEPPFADNVINAFIPVDHGYIIVISNDCVARMNALGVSHSMLNGMLLRASVVDKGNTPRKRSDARIRLLASMRRVRLCVSSDPDLLQLVDTWQKIIGIFEQMPTRMLDAQP